MSDIQIHKAISSIIYSSLIDFLEYFCSILSFDENLFESDLDTLIEIKESRNLLLHNHLKVNSSYLNKTRNIKRSNKVDEKLTIDLSYAIESCNLLLKTINSIYKNLHAKYGKYTRLKLLKELWEYTFGESGLPIRIEEFWHINIEKDILEYYNCNLIFLRI